MAKLLLYAMSWGPPMVIQRSFVRVLIVGVGEKALVVPDQGGARGREPLRAEDAPAHRNLSELAITSHLPQVNADGHPAVRHCRTEFDNVNPNLE